MVFQHPISRRATQGRPPVSIGEIEKCRSNGLGIRCLHEGVTLGVLRLHHAGLEIVEDRTTRGGTLECRQPEPPPEVVRRDVGGPVDLSDLPPTELDTGSRS